MPDESDPIGIKVAEALGRFAAGPGVDERSAALSAILAERALSRIVDTPEFASGLEGLSADIHADAPPETQLRSLAELVRIGQSYPPLAAKTESILQTALQSEPPAVALLSNGADRGYIAKALALVDGAWVPKYAARAIAEESTAERARGEFMNVLTARVLSISALLEHITDAVAEITLETEKPADTLLKRLTRILGAVRSSLTDSHLPTGDDVGKSFARLLGHSLDRFGKDVTETTARGLIAEVLLTTHQLVRSRLSVATDVGTYAALKHVRTALAPSGWPAGLTEECDLIGETVSEAILLLAKQGITSSGLRRLLEVVSGELHSDHVLKEMADGHPGLSEPVRAWLARRPVSTDVAGSAALKRQAALESDDLVGECLLAEHRLSRRRQDAKVELGPALKVLDPSMVPTLDQLLVASEQVSEAIAQLATARSIGLLGTPGQEVDFSDKYFDTPHAAPQARMTVVRAAVVRLDRNGRPGEPILKGIVR